MLFALFSLPDRTLLATASSVSGLPSSPVNSGIVELPEWDQVPPSPYRWDTTVLNFTQPRPGMKIERQTFMDRIGDVALGNIMYASWQNDAGGAALRGWLLRYLIVSDINVDDPRTIAGVDALIAAGLIPSDRRDVILAPAN